MELYLLRWPVLLPKRVEEWYGAHREAFDCLVVVMDKETATSIYNEKDWLVKEEGKDEDLKREKAITSMLRVARISTEKGEVDNGKKSKKVVAGGGLWGRALKDLEAADKEEKNKEEKDERGVEHRREHQLGSVMGRKGGVGRGSRKGSLEGTSVGDQSRLYGDRTKNHDNRANGHDDRTNGHDYRYNSFNNRPDGEDCRKNTNNGKTNGQYVNLIGQNVKEEDLRNTMRKGVKDRLGRVENFDKNKLGNEKKGETKETLADGDLRGRLNRLKSCPGAAGDWTGNDKIKNGGVIINVSNQYSRRNIADASPNMSPRNVPLSPDLSPRNVSLSPPTPDWKNEPPLEGNWADDLDSWE